MTTQSEDDPPSSADLLLEDSSPLPPDVAALLIKGAKLDKLDKPKLSHFDQVFKYIKPYGWYQLLTLIIVQYTCINVSGNFFFMTFGGMRSTTFCDGEEIDDQCTTKYLNCTNITEVKHFHSLYDDYDFSCELDFVPGMIATMQMIGAGVGEAIGGHLADYFGRKRMVVLGYSSMLALGLITGIAPNWQTVMICVVGMGVCYGVQTAAMFTLASETVGMRYRIMQSCAFQWSLGFQFVAAIAFFTRTWRSYILTINIICLPVILLMLVLTDSPRWLIQRKKHGEALKCLRKIGKVNRVKTFDLTEDDLTAINFHSGKVKQFTVLDLFRSKKFCKYSLVMAISAISAECIPAVFMFNVQALAGSPFLNVSLYGLLRIWIPFFLVLMETKTTWFGRRNTFVCSQGVVSFCFIGILLIHVLRKQAEWKVFATVLSQIGTVVDVAVLWTIYKQYVTELYPTMMRGIALGTFSLSAVAGSALAPQLVYLKKFWPGIPYAGACFLSTLSLILGILILPETRNSPLPDSLASGAKSSVRTPSPLVKGRHRHETTDTGAMTDSNDSGYEQGVVSSDDYDDSISIVSGRPIY